MDFKIIGDFWGEFFQQPEDSFRLAALEMVDFQISCGRHLGHSIQSHGILLNERCAQFGSFDGHGPAKTRYCNLG